MISLNRLFFIGLLLPAVFGAPAEKKDKGQIWAVLVAGSNGYENYRHQADICHAYQIFHRHGVPDSNIIVMMYDDIAHNDQNPKKGKIFNKPNGDDVYKGVKIDYSGAQVTPKNFVNVLTGNKKEMVGVGSGKVLGSGPNDHVFVNFDDHGSTGLIGFPSSYMYADDLIKALKTMQKKKMYKRLVFYMEACESGSMFDKILPPNINIFATTAANPDESSYACYWSDELEAFMGDEYSVSWMEDIDSEAHHKNYTTETLLKQYTNVVKRVKESHPSKYGEMKIDKDHVMTYIGKDPKQTLDSKSKLALEPFKDAVSSRDVALHTLNKKIELATSEGVKQELQKKRDALVQGRKVVDDLFGRILERVTGMNARDRETMEDTRSSISLEMMPCYKTLVDNFSSSCVNINRNVYALGHLYKFANLCATEYSSTDDILKVLSEECGDNHRALNNVN